MSEYSQIQAKLINVLNRKVVKHKTVYKSDNNVMLIDGKTKCYYTIHRIGNTNMGILIPSNINNTKANCWYIVGKNLFDGGGNPDTHEYVDLGLPSGTLWATDYIRNADNNILYFSWGEVQGFTAENPKSCDWNNYKFGTQDNITKYNSTDNKIILDAEDDAATVLWGEKWCMPTVQQAEELSSSAYWRGEVTEDGIKYYVYKYNNGTEYKIPSSGYIVDTNFNLDNTRFWIKELYRNDKTKARAVNRQIAVTASRCYGQAVLPVRANN